MKFIIEILLMGVGVSLAAFFVPGMQVSGFGNAVLAGVLIALANATIGTLLRVLTFPVNILTLGLTSFVITVMMVLLVSRLMGKGHFYADSFWSAAAFSLVLAVVKVVLSIFY